MSISKRYVPFAMRNSRKNSMKCFLGRLPREGHRSQGPENILAFQTETKGAQERLIRDDILKVVAMFHLIDKLKTLFFCKLLIIYSRYLIGFAFVFASFVKIRGERFTTIPTSEPVGYFFEAMYQTGF